MSEEVIDSSAEAGSGERPVFLTVLCILSFVAAGLGVLGYIAALTAMGMAEAAMGGLSEAVANAGGVSAAPVNRNYLGLYYCRICHNYFRISWCNQNVEICKKLVSCYTL